MTDTLPKISDSILQAEQQSKVAFTEHYKGLSKEDGEELLQLSLSRVDANNLKDWIQIAYFPEFNGLVFLNKDTSEYYKICGFANKARGIDFSFWFAREEKANKFIESWSANKKAIADEKEKITNLDLRKEEIIKIGDILKSSWGYEKINVNYYQVIGFIGKKTVEFQRITKQSLTKYIDGKTGRCVPVKDSFINDVILVGRASVTNINSSEPKVTVAIPVSQRMACLERANDDGSYLSSHYSI